MLTQAVIASTLEMVALMMLSVSERNAMEPASRKTLKQRLAWLKNWVSSLRMILEYLSNKISMNAKVRNAVTNV
jgi:hypothetical protein